MLLANYPEYKTHVLEHVQFIMKTLELSLNIKEGTEERAGELLNYLKDWYSSHVLGVDRHYIPYLTDKMEHPQ